MSDDFEREYQVTPLERELARDLIASVQLGESMDRGDVLAGYISDGLARIAELERDKRRVEAALENALDASAEGGWMARALDAEATLARVLADLAPPSEVK